MTRLSTLCMATTLLLPASAALATPDAAPAPAAQIDRTLAASYRPDAPGATVIVVKDGKTVLRQAYGLADIAHNTPLTPATPMRLGSITKQFTSTAILLLVDEGKIKLDADITAYLPDYPTHGKSITIEHLLTHTSGIASFTGKADYEANMGKDVTVAGMIASFQNDPLDFDPGSRYKYNNSAYFLLGAIIEKVSGLRYDEFIAQRIFAPLGMTHTAYEGHERSAGTKEAIGYSGSDGHFAPSAYISMTQPYAAGSVVSTVDDLARWDAAVSSGKLLKPATWQRAFTPYTLRVGDNAGKSTGYGYGWTISQLKGTPMISHGGGINGFNTYALRLPSAHLYVAVLSNTDSGAANARDSAFKAAAIALGKPFPDYQAITLPASALDAWSGVYRGSDGATRTLRRDGDKLVLERADRAPLTLAAFSANGFFAPGSLFSMELTRAAQGGATTLTLHQPEEDQVFQRSGDAPPPPAAVRIDNARFDAWAGRYQLTPKLVLAVTREGDRYYAQATGQPRIEIVARDEHTFFSAQANAELRFDDATPAQLTLHQGGRDIKAAKLP